MFQFFPCSESQITFKITEAVGLQFLVLTITIRFRALLVYSKIKNELRFLRCHLGGQSTSNFGTDGLHQPSRNKPTSNELKVGWCGCCCFQGLKSHNHQSVIYIQYVNELIFNSTMVILRACHMRAVEGSPFPPPLRIIKMCPAKPRWAKIYSINTIR